jgi:tetratricopeptide (TPR) repeat protein
MENSAVRGWYIVYERDVIKPQNWEEQWAHFDERERWCADFATLLGPEAIPATWIHQLTRGMLGTLIEHRLSIRNSEADAVDRLVEVGGMTWWGDHFDLVQINPDLAAWRTNALSDNPARQGACGNALSLFASERARAIKQAPEGSNNGAEAACLLTLARRLAELNRLTVAIELVTTVSNAIETLAQKLEAETLLTDLLSHIPESEYRFRHVSALLQVGRLQHRRKAFVEACATYQRAIVLGREKTEPRSGSEAIAHCQLGMSLSEMGDLTGADRELRYCITMLRQHLPADHPRLGVPYHELAALMSKVGRWRDAVDFFEQAIATQEKTDPENKLVAESYLGIASAQVKVKYFRGALAPAERALELRQRRLRADDPKLLVFYNIVAIVLRELGNHAKAIELLQIVLGMKSRTLGEDHADTLGTRTLLAKSMEATGDTAGATAQWERILAIRSGRAEDAALAVALNNYAINLGRLHRYDDAIVQYERAMDVQDRLMSETDVRRPLTYLNAAVMLRKLHRFERALGLATGALTLLRRTEPRDEAKLKRASDIVKSLIKDVAGI